MLPFFRSPYHQFHQLNSMLKTLNQIANHSWSAASFFSLKNMEQIHEIIIQVDQLMKSPLFQEWGKIQSTQSNQRSQSSVSDTIDFNQVAKIMQDLNKIANLEIWKMFRN